MYKNDKVIKRYSKPFKRKNVDISLTHENHCHENAIAECVDGILKNEFYLDQTFANVTQAKRATKIQLIFTTK
ncbi:hypothetical protein [Psychroflexus torquis]|uniref:hypothetical protein n=1 Tax=Psychroflexus torquis TaxID=57029 RepID=UPI0000D55085|nr:hypothetical protein [Psychroflexus torquis]